MKYKQFSIPYEYRVNTRKNSRALSFHNAWDTYRAQEPHRTGTVHVGTCITYANFIHRYAYNEVSSANTLRNGSPFRTQLPLAATSRVDRQVGTPFLRLLERIIFFPHRLFAIQYCALILSSFFSGVISSCCLPAPLVTLIHQSRHLTVFVFSVFYSTIGLIWAFSYEVSMNWWHMT